MFKFFKNLFFSHRQIPDKKHTKQVNINDIIDECLCDLNGYGMTHTKPTFFHYRQAKVLTLQKNLANMKYRYGKAADKTAQSNASNDIINYLYVNYKAIINNSSSSTVAKNLKSALTSILGINESSSHKTIYDSILKRNGALVTHPDGRAVDINFAAEYNSRIEVRPKLF